MTFTEAIAYVVEKGELSEEEAYQAMSAIMDGQITDAQIACFVTALRMKNETINEITGFARAIREKALKINPPHDFLVDTCGTGGDMRYTFNISTTAAFVVAACGLPVAKHGNRSVSSKCGSADVLEALGVNLDLSPVEVSRAIKETGIGFLFAPAFHAAMKHAGKARKEVGIRTVFNLLGPLTNPGAANIQLVGVFAPALTEVLGKVLYKLGLDSALVVHGAGGLDEVSTLGPTRITEVKNSLIRTYEISPGMFGIPEATASQLRGGSAEDNAKITLRVLEGRQGPEQDVVVINAAAALYAAGKVSRYKEGVEMAREAILSGAALQKLKLMQQYSSLACKKEAGAENISSTA
ncbi:MAG: anthranilate phosphoribosyltransferase [Bacillota bacterium]